MAEILLGEEPLNSEITKIEKEVINGYRDFIISDKFKTVYFRVYEPTNDQQDLVAQEYTNKFNELFAEKKNLAWEQIVTNLRERGLWTDDDENFQEENTEQQKNIVAQYLKHVEIKENIDPDFVARLKAEYFRLKKLSWKHTEKRNSYYANSIESMANNHAIKYKMYLCLFHKDESGEYVPYFKTFEELNASRDAMFLRKVLRECITFWAGISQEYLNEAPEADIIFGGKGLLTLLENSDGAQSTPSTKKAGKRSSTKSS